MCSPFLFSSSSCSSSSASSTHSLPLQLLLYNIERHIEQLGFLLEMRALESRGYAGTGIPACIHDVSSVMMLGLIQQGLDSRLGEAPRARVEGFFLCPYDGFGVGVGVEVFA